MKFPKIYEQLVCLVVHRAGHLYAGYVGFLRHPLRAITYDVSLGLRHRGAKRHAYDHDYAHHLPGLLWQVLGDSGIIIVQHASQQSHKGWLSFGCSPPPPRPCFLPEVHQSVHDVFVRPDTRIPVDHVYKRRKEYIEEEGSEHPPLANALSQSEPSASDTFCIPYIHSIAIVGVEKERRTKTRPIVKPEKTALVLGTVLRTTGPVPVESRQ